MDQKWEIVFGSDVQRDGVYLELREVDKRSHSPLLEVFRSDQDGSVTCYLDGQCELPFSILEEFVRRARAEVANRRNDTNSSSAGTA